MSAQPSPDSKKKKPALPSLLSNLRNARQAVVGRASDAAEDLLYERELRPLTGGGGGGSSGALGLLGSTSTGGGGPQHLQRGGGVGGGAVGGGGVGGIGAPSTSMPSNATTFSSTMQNFSQRFGNKFRGGSKSRNRRKKGSGVTVVPQEFYVAVGCFFFVFPIFFMIYIYIAGHSVFGYGNDDGHEITRKNDQENEGVRTNQTYVDPHGDNSKGMLLEDEIMDNLHDRFDDSIMGVDSEGQHSNMKMHFSKRDIDSSLMEEDTNELTGYEDGNASAMKLAKLGSFKGTLRIREREAEDGRTRSSFDQNDERRRA